MANVKFNRGKTRANSITAAKTIGGYSTVYFPTDSATIVLGIGSTTDNREYGQAVQDVAGTERAFLLGHAAQGSIATTISNANVYMQEDKLYSNNSEVVNVADAQTISGDKTFAGKIIKSGGTGDQVLAADGSVRTIESAVTAGSDSLVTSGAVDVQIKTIDDRIAALEATGPSMNITWSELKALRDAGSLIPGMQYRITDYTCTTVTSGTKSAGHQFDIIVVADDESTLNETARAIKHEGDEYFANNDLNAWRIWYCLDNDTSRFDWADVENGKGVIYRMIDEFNNDVPYDFKNIQFYRQWDLNTSLWSTIPTDNTGVPCYTFSSEGNSDTTEFTDMSLTLSNLVESNVIKICVLSNFIQALNNICFFGTTCRLNTFEKTCGCITLGSYCFSNTFGNGCMSINLGNSSDFNTLGGCIGINFGIYCLYNTLGTDCMGINFGDHCGYNTLGDGCYYDSLGEGCIGNIFAANCKNNTLGDGCRSNSFGSDCEYNVFATDASGTTPASYFKNNKFESGVSYCILSNVETASPSLYVQNYRVRSSVVGTTSSKRVIKTTRGLTYDTTVALNSEGTIKAYCEADLAQ